MYRLLFLRLLLKDRSLAIKEEFDFERLPESVDVDGYPLADEWKEKQRFCPILGNVFDVSAECAFIST